MSGPRGRNLGSTRYAQGKGLAKHLGFQLFNTVAGMLIAPPGQYTCCNFG